MLEIKFINSIACNQVNLSKVVQFLNFKLFTDGVNKMMLFDVRNTFKENLISITFKITQYDSDGHQLKREVKTLKDLCIRPKRIYSTEDLYKVDVMLDHVDVEILTCDFVTICYDEGALSSTYVKTDKAGKRKLKRLAKKAKKKPNKVKKQKEIKDVVEYQFKKDVHKKSALIGVLCLAFLATLLTIIVSFFAWNPGPDAIILPHLVRVIGGIL